MAFTKTAWVDGTTPLTAVQLNRLETQYDEALSWVKQWGLGTDIALLTGNFNDVVVTGFYRWANGAANAPNGADFFFLNHINWGPSDAAQTATALGSGTVYTRKKQSNTWSAWKKMYDSGNIQKGMTALTLFTTQFNSISVTFTTPFDVAPTVVATASGQTTYICSVSNVTTTGFVLWARYYEPTNMAETVNINWVAIS